MTTAIVLEPAPIVEISATREPVPASEPSPLLVPAKPRKPRVWTAFVTLFVAAIAGQIATFLAAIAVGIGVGVVMGAQGADSAAIQVRVQEIFLQPLPVLLLSLIPFQIGMTIVLLSAARRSKEPVKVRLGLLPQTGRKIGSFKLATMAAFTLSIAWTSIIVSSLVGSATPTSNPLGSVINDGSWLAISLVSILLSLIPALVEESLFRGYLQRRFLQRWSPAVAIGLSTLLFALMHWDSLQHVIAVVPLGIVTGFLAYRTNSVRPGMLVHALHNAGVVGFGGLVRLLSSHMGEEQLGLLILGSIAVMGLIGLPAVISLLRNGKPKSAVEVLPLRTRQLSIPESAATSWLASAV